MIPGRTQMLVRHSNTERCRSVSSSLKYIYYISMVIRCKDKVGQRERENEFATKRHRKTVRKETGRDISIANCMNFMIEE